MMDWAMKRAEELVRAELEQTKHVLGLVPEPVVMKAFAAYIRGHEQPPEDPDLIEARKIAMRLLHHDDHSELMRGGFDDDPNVKTLVAALKCGRELERGGNLCGL